MPVKVLLAADDSERWDGVSAAMRSLGLAVRHTRTGEEFLRLQERIAPGLVVVATDLPDIHGLDVCRRLRRHSDVPMIVLDSEARDLDRVLALELGADDVLTDHCSLEEARERVRAALRRSAGVQTERDPNEVLNFGRIVIDHAANRLTVDGKSYDLTPTECELLRVLGQHAGEVVESEYLLETVWGYPRGVQTRTLDVHIGRVRRKLGEDGRAPRHIITVRSVGYRFEPGEASSQGEEVDEAA